MQPAISRIGLLIGSSRVQGNGTGLAAWLSSVLDSRLNASRKSYEIVSVNPTLGPVVEGARLPAQISDASSYSASNIQQWSTFVSSCAGFAILTPEYNYGYPGELKNAIDHLYNEWKGKPVALVTYGSFGGQSCAAQLATVLAGIKMQVVTNTVNISLPPPFVSESERVVPGEKFPDFLASYEDQVKKAADELANKITTSA